MADIIIARGLCTAGISLGPFKMSAFLYVTVALAWGFTWYAIHLQLGPTPDSVSIFWRFAVAAALMWLGLAATRQLKAAPYRQHRWFTAMGLTLFCGNFLCLYEAEHSVSSGLVAVIFSMASIFNAFNQWCFRGIRPSPRSLLGAATGILGVACLFGQHITEPSHGHYLRGILLALAGTYSFSLGNLISGKASANGVDLPNAIARGMSWGVVILAVIILARGQNIVPHLTTPYLGGLIYLALIGSVVGFLAYLSLVNRVGATKAAYVTVISPVIALAVSSILENYAWDPQAALGISLIIMGNLIIFYPTRRFRTAR